MSGIRRDSQSSLDEFEADLLKWKVALNLGSGLLGFNLAIGCLGTFSPGHWALVSLIFIVSTMWYGCHYFPKCIRAQRKHSISGVDDNILVELEKQHFGMNRMIANFPFFFMVVAMLALIMADIDQWLKYL